MLIASIRLLFTAPTSFDPYATCTSLDLVIEHPYFWTAWAVSPILTWIHTKSMGFLRPFFTTWSCWVE